MGKKVCEIIKEYLGENHLDGLTNMEYPNEEDCCCDIENLGCWCGGKDIYNCYFGKKVMTDFKYDEENSEINWMIIPHYKKDE